MISPRTNQNVLGIDHHQTLKYIDLYIFIYMANQLTPAESSIPASQTPLDGSRATCAGRVDRTPCHDRAPLNAPTHAPQSSVKMALAHP